MLQRPPALAVGRDRGLRGVDRDGLLPRAPSFEELEEAIDVLLVGRSWTVPCRRRR
jgi:hypothetical protein